MSNVYQPGNGLNQFENAYPDGGNAGPPLSCEGTPENQIFADPGSKCIDILTQDLYVKVAGTGKVGWQLNGKMAIYMSVVAQSS